MSTQSSRLSNVGSPTAQRGRGPVPAIRWRATPTISGGGQFQESPDRLTCAFGDKWQDDAEKSTRRNEVRRSEFPERKHDWLRSAEPMFGGFGNAIHASQTESNGHVIDRSSSLLVRKYDDGTPDNAATLVNSCLQA